MSLEYYRPHVLRLVNEGKDMYTIDKIIEAHGKMSLDYLPAAVDMPSNIEDPRTLRYIGTLIQKYQDYKEIIAQGFFNLYRSESGPESPNHSSIISYYRHYNQGYLSYYISELIVAILDEDISTFVRILDDMTLGEWPELEFRHIKYSYIIDQCDDNRILEALRWIYVEGPYDHESTSGFLLEEYLASLPDEIRSAIIQSYNLLHVPHRDELLWRPFVYRVFTMHNDLYNRFYLSPEDVYRLVHDTLIYETIGLSRIPFYEVTGHLDN